jgi:TonB family protein
MRRHFIGLALLFASAMTWSDVNAQSSSVTLKPRPDGTMAEPAALLGVGDAEYPLYALLGNVEGTVSLNLVVGVDGRVVFAQVLQSSGSSLLDQTAAQIARTKWTFKPAQDGGAATASALVDIAWKLPLTPADNYRFQAHPLPEGAQPPRAITSHAIQADDYPGDAVRAGVQGIVALRYLVDEQGSVSKTEVVQSSGTRSLDDAATRMITRRWKFEPARSASGMPISVWQGAFVEYVVRSPVSDRRRLGCHAKPLEPGENEHVLITATLLSGYDAAGQVVALQRSATVSFNTWTFVDANGVVADILLWTSKGWMRVSKPVVDALKQTGYRRPGETGCWHYETIMARALN